MKELRDLTELLVNFYKTEEIVKKNSDRFVPIGVSNRHIHLAKEDLEALFGKGHELTNIKDLSQPGQFAAKEMVTIVGPKGLIEKVRVLGPCRKETQVEIFMGDCFKLGVKPELRMSSDLEGTPGLTLIGPCGCVHIYKGVIVAKRHLHVNLDQARDLDLKDGQVISLKFEGPRGGILDNVIVRADEKAYLDCHIDTEEANAFGIKNGQKAKIIY